MHGCALRQRLEQGTVGGADHRDPRLRVPQEVVDFVRRARDIDRHVHRAHAQAGHVQQYRIRRFFHLHCDPVPRHDAEPRQRRGETRRLVTQTRIVHVATHGSPQE
jgi:hypothetical protein